MGVALVRLYARETIRFDHTIDAKDDQRLIRSDQRNPAPAQQRARGRAMPLPDRGVADELILWPA